MFHRTCRYTTNTSYDSCISEKIHEPLVQHNRRQITEQIIDSIRNSDSWNCLWFFAYSLIASTFFVCFLKVAIPDTHIHFWVRTHYGDGIKLTPGIKHEVVSGLCLRFSDTRWCTCMQEQTDHS